MIAIPIGEPLDVPSPAVLRRQHVLRAVIAHRAALAKRKSTAAPRKKYSVRPGASGPSTNAAGAAEALEQFRRASRSLANPLKPKPQPEELPMPLLANGHATKKARRTHCESCGGPVNAVNGRCYKCRPGGGGGRPRKPADGEVAATPALRRSAPPSRNRIAAPEVLRSLPTSPLAAEVRALVTVAEALAGLEPDSAAWVLESVSRHYRKA